MIRKECRLTGIAEIQVEQQQRQHHQNNLDQQLHVASGAAGLRRRQTLAIAIVRRRCRRCRRSGESVEAPVNCASHTSSHAPQKERPPTRQHSLYRSRSEPGLVDHGIGVGVFGRVLSVTLQSTRLRNCTILAWTFSMASMEASSLLLWQVRGEPTSDRTSWLEYSP